jgi:hypothetical protein
VAVEDLAEALAIEHPDPDIWNSRVVRSRQELDDAAVDQLQLRRRRGRRSKRRQHPQRGEDQKATQEREGVPPQPIEWTIFLGLLGMTVSALRIS